MAKKVVTNNVALGALWLLGMFMFLLTVNSHFDAPSSVWLLALATGAIIWGLVGYFDARKTFMAIEQYGVTGVHASGVFSLKRAISVTFAMLAAVIGVIVLGFYIAYYQPYWQFLINLLVPFPSAILLTNAVLCWRWQRRNKRTLYVEGSKVYPYPYMNMPQQ
ncbi:MAG: hypothetical protein ACQCN4_08140 [Candidatus Bathyarchaeia archaeon]|jgi:hypothetical protein